MENHFAALSAKLMTPEQAIAWRKTCQAQGLKVAFTNGCFDVLHLGHVTYLAKAADCAQKLIVAINTDASVRMLEKAPQRPINPQEARAIVLAGFAFVDAVVLFDAATPLALIEALQPDVLVKGADYDAHEQDPHSKRYIVGSDIVRQAGGEVRTIELVAGYSTTAILEKGKP